MQQRSLALGLLASMSCQAACQTQHGFDTIKSSTNLTWTPCFDGLGCSKLQVPLDYANPGLGTTDVAFLKVPGKQATPDSQTIVWIQGGPGGSGIDVGLAQRELAGVIFGQQYNIVFFDPRGVSNSGLKLDCFPGSTAARAAFTSLHKTGITNTSTDSLQEQFYSSEIYAEWCNDAVVKTNSPHAYYVTTPAAARDVLTFVEADARATGHGKPEDAKLWAYGVSYGTVTGATFATLFPSRVGRLVLDGVVDAEQYYDNEWLDNLDQSDAAIEYFAETCHAAGKNRCSFWGPSATDILSRLDALIARLRDRPVPISGLDGTQQAMVTQADIKMLLLNTVYDPLSYFPRMADVLHQAETGNFTALAGTYASKAALKTTDAGSQIMCADTTRRNKQATIGGFAGYVDASAARSRYIGDLWPIEVDGVLCSALRPELPDSMVMTEPIGAVENPTAFPIMFASNTIDPISALSAAKKASAKFKDSVLLQQKSVGHTIAALLGSTCYFTNVQMYFAGILPASNTTCPQERFPFQM